MKEKKKNITLLTAVAVLGILIIVLSITYAFFAPQQGGTTSTNATVTSNTTDLLTFSINRDISFTVTQADFQENGQNQSGDATATATLTPNNKTGAATMNYYLYLNIESNPTVYSVANTNEDPELMLQVFDGNNQLVTLTGLGTQKTIKGVTGYDITGVEGLQTLLDNHAISASNNTATIENWRIVITLINLDVNQNDNTGKEISAEIIIREDSLDDPITYVYWNNGFTVNEEIPADEVPSGTGLYGVYNSREQLADTMNLAYTNSEFDHNFNQLPLYIRSTMIDNNVVKHEVCLYYHSTNNEFCMGTNYWVGDAQDQIDGATTRDKLKSDLGNAVGSLFYNSSEDANAANSNYYCQNSSGGVYCLFDEMYSCHVFSDGSIRCAINYGYDDMFMCDVYSDGTAYCTKYYD